MNGLLGLGGWNSLMVLAGSTALGMAAGTVGTFMLLRRRALVSDALSHATLPGLAGAFLIGTALGGEGRSLPLLLLGAALSGILGVLIIQAVTRHTRLPEDAAIGAVLSSFFGLGVVLLSVIQNMPTAGAAGLKSFILGQTAAMSAGEAAILAALALAAAILVALMFKELRLVAFDEGFARTQGLPASRIDLILMALVTVVTVAGLQTVGLILIIALLITPPAAARFWTERLPVMTVMAALIGGLSGGIGTWMSAVFADLPAGAVIVLVTSGLFILSFLFAPARGVLARLLRHLRLKLTLAERQALLALRDGRPAPRVVCLWLCARRWARRTPDGVTLTAFGEAKAAAAERDRRLWARFVADYPHLLPNSGSWGVEPVDRALPRDLVHELERRDGWRASS